MAQPERRLAFLLADRLGRTVEQLGREMSAEEFLEWQVMYQAEGLTPGAQRLRHAQLLAAMHNGPLGRRDKTLWKPGQFVSSDPWRRAAVVAAPTAESIAAQVAAINARIDP
ncbi:MAG: hypothetical protein IBJ14_05030 [Hydrogenophaga sp.]|nr:hypothetical protein [Hydrogenophaga sp.]